MSEATPPDQNPHESRTPAGLVGGWVPFLSIDASEDPLDIWYVVKRYPGGIDALIGTFRPHLSHGLIKQGLEILARKFERLDSWAPTRVGAFDSALSADEQEERRRDAYERIGYLLTELGFKTS